MSIHIGHRKRITDKIKKDGFEALEPHERLEFLLFFAIPRKNTNDIAHRLLDRFVTVSGVINADDEELLKVEGVGPQTVQFLKSLPVILGIVERELLTEQALKFDNYETIEGFAKTYFYGKLSEAVYLISLNSSYRLISCTRLSVGWHDDVLLHPNQAVRQAICDGASAVIVAHNHPCGNINPSVADMTLTGRLIEAFATVEIDFLDSLVISGGKCLSIRNNYEWNKLSKQYKPR